MNRLHQAIAVAVCFVGALLVVVLAKACVPQAKAREPVPKVVGLDHLVEQVDLLAARHMVDSELHAQATAYVLGRAQERSMRGFKHAIGKAPSRIASRIP